MTHGGRSQETFLIQWPVLKPCPPLLYIFRCIFCPVLLLVLWKNPLVSSTVLNTSESKKSVCSLAQANHQEKDLCKHELVWGQFPTLQRLLGAAHTWVPGSILMLEMDHLRHMALSHWPAGQSLFLQKSLIHDALRPLSSMAPDCPTPAHWRPLVNGDKKSRSQTGRKEEKWAGNEGWKKESEGGREEGGEREREKREGGRERRKEGKKMKKKQTHRSPWVKHRLCGAASRPTTPNPTRNISSLWDWDQSVRVGPLYLPTCGPHASLTHRWKSDALCTEQGAGSRAPLVPKLMSPSGPPAKKVRKLRQASGPSQLSSAHRQQPRTHRARPAAQPGGVGRQAESWVPGFQRCPHGVRQGDQPVVSLPGSQMLSCLRIQPHGLRQALTSGVVLGPSTGPHVTSPGLWISAPPPRTELTRA